MTQTRLWQAIALAALAALVIVLIAKRSPAPVEGEVPRAVSLPPIGYETVSFAALPGWEDDAQQSAIGPFLRSCERLLAQPPQTSANPVEYIGPDQPVSLAGRTSDWRPACDAAVALVAEDRLTAEEARAFFEEYFVPVRISQPEVVADEDPVMTDTGLFTGYFEPIFPASASPTEALSAPVLTRPDDLVTVDLGAFRSELVGQRLAGRVNGGELVPYDTHAQINNNPPDAEILAWMNPNDLLFMQIQGSGRLSIDGRDISVGYAAPNGHPYTAIGRELVEMGEIPLEQISMQSIYEWLASAPPEEAARVREVNESYIFFRPMTMLKAPGLGPVGAQGVQLSAGRSLAVDRRYHTLGAPVWVDLDSDDTHPDALQRLFIAQDTGGAIRGPVRGDVFVGSGAEAGGEAGMMRRRGRLYTLLPVGVAERLGGDSAQQDADS